MEKTTTTRKLRRENSLDFQFGKVPPQNKEIEEAVLGTIMLHREAFDLVVEILQPLSFYVEAHQHIFEAMMHLAQKSRGIDMMTVCEELRGMEKLDNVGGAYAVSKLTNGHLSGSNVENHARIIHEKFMLRELIRIGWEISSKAFDDSTDVFELINVAETSIMSIGDNNVKSDMVGIASVLSKALNKIEEWRKNDTHVTGVTTGFPEMDQATRGWQPGDLIILAARPSVGKTALALNLIRNAAKAGTTVAVWSLEMKSIYLALRMLASESNILLQRIQTGRLDDEQMRQLMKDGVENLASYPIHFDDKSNVSLRTITSKARKLKKKNNLGLIVIDYLQLMAGVSDKSGNREQEVSKISRDLKNLAQELEIPIIALSQITREASKSVKWESGPPVSSLRESGAIEQDADTIMMLWGADELEEKQDPSLQGKRKVKIAKQRNGVVLTIKLDFKNEIQLFTAIEDKLEIPKPNVEQTDMPF